MRTFHFRISSNKRRVPNKGRSFEYPHRNKRLSLINASPLISDAPVRRLLEWLPYSTSK